MEETVQTLIEKLYELPAVKETVIEVSPELYHYMSTRLPSCYQNLYDNKNIPIQSYYGITVIKNYELTELQWKISLMGRE